MKITIEDFADFAAEITETRQRLERALAWERQLLRMLAIHQLKHGPIDVQVEESTRGQLETAADAKGLAFSYHARELSVTLGGRDLTPEILKQWCDGKAI